MLRYSFHRFGVFFVIVCFAVNFAIAGDYKELVQKLEILSLKGNPEANYHLGMMHNNGIEYPKDYKKAFELFTKAAEGGDPLGAYKLGCYFEGQAGDAVKADPQKALKFKRISAVAGYVNAQSDVGIEYFKLKKFSEAAKFWKMAALQGHPQSTYNLSQLYLDGTALPKDLVLAYAYFKIAQLLSRGEITQNAQKALDEISSKFTKEQKTKAEKIVSDWKPQKTELTRKALSGLDAARELASSTK